MAARTPYSAHCRARLTARAARAAADAIIAVTFYGDAAPESFGTFARGFVAMFRIMIGRWGAARGPRTRDTDRPRRWRASGSALNPDAAARFA